MKKLLLSGFIISSLISNSYANDIASPVSEANIKVVQQTNNKDRVLTSQTIRLSDNIMSVIDVNYDKGYPVYVETCSKEDNVCVHDDTKKDELKSMVQRIIFSKENGKYIVKFPGLKEEKLSKQCDSLYINKETGNQTCSNKEKSITVSTSTPEFNLGDLASKKEILTFYTMEDKLRHNTTQVRVEITPVIK